MNVREKTEELGGKIVAAPNAMYATGFPNKESIEKFVAWLDDNDFSHGNIIPMRGEREGTFDIRYEK